MVDIYGYVLIEGYLITHGERCYCSQTVNLYGKTNQGLKEALEASEVRQLIDVQLGPHPQTWIQVISEGLPEHILRIFKAYVQYFLSLFSLHATCTAHTAAHIQGTFRAHSGDIQGTFRKHSGNIQCAAAADRATS
jgi:hypothetical protein